MVLVITEKEMNQIINHPSNIDHLGKFMTIKSKDDYLCCNNQDGQAKTQTFSDLILATKWLNGLIDVGNKHDN